MLPPERRRDPDTLLVLAAVLSRRTVTAAGLAPVLQKDPEKVETILRRLTAPDVALVEQTRNTLSHRHGTFRLAARWSARPTRSPGGWCAASWTSTLRRHPRCWPT
jgi:hypothetical protein